MDNIEGELNRRLALLTVLYFQRRTNPNKPEVSFRDIETRLGFPRDYLVFTAGIFGPRDTSPERTTQSSQSRLTVWILWKRNA